MLKKPAPSQTALEMVTLDSLVPKDHLLRKIDAVIDFSFIHDRVAGLYCADNGRPALDPTLMFKALFIGYLFGIRSERQLVREIEVNVAYRWFLRMKLTDGVFDASTLSQNRRRRFNDASVAQDIFDHIVGQAIRRHRLPHPDAAPGRHDARHRGSIGHPCHDRCVHPAPPTPRLSTPSPGMSGRIPANSLTPLSCSLGKSARPSHFPSSKLKGGNCSSADFSASDQLSDTV